jgi:U3 small nucleolar RNA-associated protein 7
MKKNPHNAIIALGHSNGRVTMWSPNMSTALVTMNAHRGISYITYIVLVYHPSVQ